MNGKKILFGAANKLNLLFCCANDGVGFVQKLDRTLLLLFAMDFPNQNSNVMKHDTKHNESA